MIDHIQKTDLTGHFTINGEVVTCDDAYNAYVYEGVKPTPSAKTILDGWKAEAKAKAEANEKAWKDFNSDPYSRILG